MKNKFYDKGANKKTITLLTVICFLIISINQSIVIPKPLEEPTTLCYGFILPSVKYENRTIENQINCKIRHLVNDLLREQIPVYWASINFTATIGRIDIYEELDMSFEKGTFIVPFTGNETQDAKLVAIICDYNQSSEIEKDNSIETPIYQLIMPLNIQVYLLSEVKIAQYRNIFTSCVSWYMQVANKCGFLTFEILESRDLAEKLNNDDFNVIMWPGGDSYYDFLTICLIKCFLDLSSRNSNVVREFINNGGGYIGSCDGTIAASCGFLPIPIYLKRRAYNPGLSSLWFLAIIDIITTFLPDGPGERQEHIVNDTHPVTYGVDKILINGTPPGPNIVHTGKNVQVISVYTTDSAYNGTPSCVSSRFGSGNVVAFCGHPEIRDLDAGIEYYDLGVEDYCNGKKLTSNALYYTTSKGIIDLVSIQSRNLSFISNNFEKTSDLTIGESRDIFYEIKNFINENINELTNLTNKIDMIRNLIWETAQKKNVNLDDSPSFLYYRTILYTKHDLGLLAEYLKNTTKVLDILEKIYPLLENNTEFVQKIEMLKEDLHLKIDEAKNIILKELDMCHSYEDSVVKYQNKKMFSGLNEKIICKKAHDIEKQTEILFQYVPQCYFNSLKLLRTSWYNYETSIVL